MSVAVVQSTTTGSALKVTRRSIRAQVIAGLVVVAIVAGGFGGWASTMEISGALIAPGQVVVESNVKKVQHPTAGVVVVRLDDTVTKANLAIVTKNLDAAMARAARLEAEQRGLFEIRFPKQLTDRASNPDV